MVIHEPVLAERPVRVVVTDDRGGHETLTSACA